MKLVYIENNRLVTDSLAVAFEVRQYTITHMTTGLENKEQTMITQKGMAYIHKQLVEHGKLPEGEKAV